ncbi:hypothetical protein N7528_000199 [Penicillium herquei]|nr:hypothetical protein N7528_000199 [Penicillium herquei]
MKVLLAFCALAGAASIPHAGHKRPHSVTITFANEKSGHNFEIHVPADHEFHRIHTLAHTRPGGSGPNLVTSAQLTGQLSAETTCVITDNDVEIATIDSQHTFAWLMERGRHHGSIDMEHAMVSCVA